MHRYNSAAVDAINDLIRKYAQVLADADINLAAEIWATDDEVTFIHPWGREHGWEQVKQNFYENIVFANLVAGRLHVYDVAINVYEDTAWAEFSWEFHATLRHDGSAQTSTGRETQIYRRGAHGWAIVHVHYSTMPSQR